MRRCAGRCGCSPASARRSGHWRRGSPLGVGRGIAAPIQALTGQAAALGRGEPVAPLATSLSEANRVSIALAAASAGLRERERALRESEARHRQIVESATDYAIVTTDLDA